mmetsp:Transcript_103609/g.322900  ORF Transcript_103609/g.322900 Transcript_103609/m.322900 type:complete len:600 (-) Transcript_103609:27-1826(-)
MHRPPGRPTARRAPLPPGGQTGRAARGRSGTPRTDECTGRNPSRRTQHVLQVSERLCMAEEAHARKLSQRILLSGSAPTCAAPDADTPTLHALKGDAASSKSACTLRAEEIGQLGTDAEDLQLYDQSHDAPGGHLEAAAERVLQLLTLLRCREAGKEALLPQRLHHLELESLVVLLVVLRRHEAEGHGVLQGELNHVPGHGDGEVGLRLQQAIEAHVLREVVLCLFEELGGHKVDGPDEVAVDVVGEGALWRLPVRLLHVALADARNPPTVCEVFLLLGDILWHAEDLQLVLVEVAEPSLAKRQVPAHEALHVQAHGRLGPTVRVVPPAVEVVLRGVGLVPDVGGEAPDVVDDARQDARVLVLQLPALLRLREPEDALQLPGEGGHEVLEVLAEEPRLLQRLLLPLHEVPEADAVFPADGREQIVSLGVQERGLRTLRLPAHPHCVLQDEEALLKLLGGDDAIAIAVKGLEQRSDHSLKVEEGSPFLARLDSCVGLHEPVHEFLILNDAVVILVGLRHTSVDLLLGQGLARATEPLQDPLQLAPGDGAVAVPVEFPEAVLDLLGDVRVRSPRHGGPRSGFLRRGRVRARGGGVTGGPCC